MNENVICWFEIYTDNIERAKKFYSAVLNLEFQDMHMGDAMKMAGFSSPENQGVSGALIQAEGTRTTERSNTATIVYFPCHDCSVEESRVTSAGGKVTTPKMSIGEFGFCSICEDTEGNAFGLYSMS